MTKQSVGEVTSDLEQRGYVERVPDPSDGRAKIIRLTERGARRRTLGLQLIDEIEREWAERFGDRAGRRVARRARGDHRRAARRRPGGVALTARAPLSRGF